MSLRAHQVASRAAGGRVAVELLRDPADGSERHVVVYRSGGDYWLSSFRFEDADQAAVAAMVLRDFVLGAETI